MHIKPVLVVIHLLLAIAFTSLATAQEVIIPDPGLNTAIRGTLQKPAGPLTAPDLLLVTNLSACCRSITNLAGLEAARNLRILDLHSNSLANFVLPAGLPDLKILDLRDNHLTNF